MAEMVVSSLIDRLVPLLTQEAKLLRGIHGEVADIKDELDSIQSFLKDLDARAAFEEVTSEGVKTHNEGRSEILPESIFPSAMSPSDSQSPLFFPDNMSPKFSHSNSIELIFPPARSETTDSSQNDEEIIQKPFISSFSHLFPPGTTSDSDSANSICDYGPTTHSISLLFPANESDTETETETGSLAFNGTTSNLSHSIMQFYLSHSIMQFFPPARSPSQTDSSENYVITRTDIDGCVFNGTPPAHSPKFSGANSIELFFPIAKTWVKQVIEVAFRIDVAIDGYLLDVAQNDPQRRGFIGFVHKTTHLLKTLKPRHKMASEIQEICNKIEIKEETNV